MSALSRQQILEWDEQHDDKLMAGDLLAVSQETVGYRTARRAAARCRTRAREARSPRLCGITGISTTSVTAGSAISMSLSRAADRHAGVSSPARCSPSCGPLFEETYGTGKERPATVSGKWSTPKRCNCKDASGKELGRTCPKLTGRHHGTVGYSTRIPTTSGVRELRRFGFATKSEADKAATQVWDLIKLAGADTGTQQRIGDLIFRATARGGQLPAVEDVRRRLGLRRELDASETFGEAWAAWLAGRRKARDSYANTLEQHGRNWLLPVLKDIPLDRLTGEHCAMVFERIDMFNEEIEAAREDGRKPVLPGDVRGRTRYTGVATQHRIYGVLRVFLNHQWKRAHKIPFNPIYTVELEPETRDAPLVWDPAPGRSFPGLHRRRPAGTAVATRAAARLPPRRDLRAPPTTTSTPPGPRSRSTWRSSRSAEGWYGASRSRRPASASWAWTRAAWPR